MRLLLASAFALLLVAPVSAQLAAPNAAGVTFAHVHVNVVDIELHKQLWVEHFGGEVVQKGSLVTVKFPNFLLVLTEREPTGGSQGSALDHFGFKVPDIEAVHEKWRAAGYEVQAEFTGTEGFNNSYLIAPDGIRFELQEDTTLEQQAIGYHVHFWHPEYEELLDWYVDMFDAVKRQRGRTATTADVPGMNMSFQGCRTECVATQGRAIDHIGFEVENLEEFANMLVERGVEFQLMPRYIESIELTIAFFVDPAGVRVELTEGFDKY